MLGKYKQGARPRFPPVYRRLGLIADFSHKIPISAGRLGSKPHHGGLFGLFVSEEVSLCIRRQPRQGFSPLMI